jgi:MFS family permease
MRARPAGNVRKTHSIAGGRRGQPLLAPLAQGRLMSEPATSAGAAAAAVVTEQLPRNTRGLLAFDSLWALGAPACNLYTTIPAYLLVLGASRTTIQVATLTVTLFTFVQLWSSRLFGGQRRRRNSGLLWAGLGALWLGFGVLGMLGWGTLPAGFWIPGFLVLCIACGLCINFANPIWNELTVDIVPKRRRGHVASLRNAAYGICALAGLPLARWLTDLREVPHNYHLRFTVGGALLVLSCLTIFILRDPQPFAAADGEDTRENTRLSALWGQRRFRVFIAVYTLLAAAMSLAPLLLTCGRDLLALSPVQTENFTLVFFITFGAVGMFLPRLADHFGFRLVGTIAAAAVTVAFALPLLCEINQGVLLVAYALYATAQGTMVVVLINLGVELMPHVRPALLGAFGSATTLPLSLATAALGGWLVDRFGAAGYTAAFAIGCALAAGALAGYLLAVAEPRRDH